MSDRAKAVYLAAMDLTPAERGDLAEELLDSLPDDGGGGTVYATPEIEAEWAEEIARRRDEAARDPAVLVPWLDARDRIFGAVDAE